jgi:protease-4
MNASTTSKIIIIVCIFCLIAGVFSIDKNKPYMGDENQKQSKNIITNANKVAVIELNGTIESTAESSLFSTDTNATGMLKSIKLAKDDKDIKGIILKINSPGGTVAMSQNIYNQIIATRQTKPVIAVLDDVAASGGYYIASAADRIVAQDGTLTGSIGVILSFMDYHNLLINKLDINNVVIKSGKFKDIGSPTRQMTDEERELMQNIVDDSYSQFLDAIRNGRINRDDNYSAQKSELSEDVLTSHADGRVFTGRQAKNLGFIDETGDLDTAKSMIESMIKEKFKSALPAKLVSYNKKNAFSEYFSGMTEYSSGIKLKDILPTSVIQSRKPLYLWE